METGRITFETSPGKKQQDSPISTNLLDMVVRACNPSDVRGVGSTIAVSPGKKFETQSEK
jgi:hypothetical protein